MKQIISILVLCVATFSFAQERYLTKTGTVQFEASVPSFEEVKAKNSNSTAILNTKNGEFAALVLVKGFRFKNALMEEHFNENYAESDKYPKATFKGTITGFDLNAIDNNPKEIIYNGDLTFHGKTKSLKNETLTIVKTSKNSILISGNFQVDVSDFDIKIPKIVSNKLSREVDVVFEFDLAEK
ncbi:YceI family protein [Winogradskyella sp. A3E31]|uniref:YceI family protein n=1 Tax=Winogradskyella sp. A3E31 TaxID=3349637 RepID=UPI00398AE044